MNIPRSNPSMAFLVINLVVLETLRFLHICRKPPMVSFWFKERSNLPNHKLLNSHFLVCPSTCLVIIFVPVVSLDEYFCSLFGYKILMLLSLWLFVVSRSLKPRDLARWHRHKTACRRHYIKKHLYFVHALYNIYESFYLYHSVLLNAGKYNQFLCFLY